MIMMEVELMVIVMIKRYDDDGDIDECHDDENGDPYDDDGGDGDDDMFRKRRKNNDL